MLSYTIIIMILMWNLIILSIILTIVYAQNLKQIHMLFRHGERSPTSTYPKDPYKNYKWEGGLGYLTNKGKLQMYNLGENVRNHYKTFIPKYYFPLEVNFTSSPLDRCIASAELFGAGLFPPQDDQIWNSDLLWQPIPIHYLPRNEDNLLAMKSNCTEYDKEFVNVRNSAKILEYNEQYKNLYSYLTENTGKLIDNIEDVESLYNTLEIYQLNNFSLPHWLNTTLMDQMRIIGAQNLAIYSETEYMKKMKGGFFLKTITDLMEKSLINKPIIPIINVYSGHDLTIVHVMRALNLIDTLKPELGASLIFEFYDNSEIKVFYWDAWNGAVYNQQILSNCSEPCSLTEFKQAYKKILPENWAEDCQNFGFN